MGLSDGNVHISQFGINNSRTQSFNTESDMPVTHIRWMNPTNLYASNADGNLVHYNITNQTVVDVVKEEDNHILAMDHNRELFRVATAGKDCAIRLYDDTTKEVVRKYGKGDWYSPGHSNRIFALRFKHDDPNALISGGWDGSVFIWDIRQRNHVAAFAGPNVSGDTIDTRDNVMLIGSHRGKNSLELWDFGTRKKICNVHWNNNPKIINAYIYQCQFSKGPGEDQILAGCSVLNEVQVYGRNITYSPLWTVNRF